MNIEDFTFIAGVGNYNENQACIMSACVAKWRMEHGEPLGEATDSLECVCPVVRRAAIRINDGPYWDDDKQRTDALLPFVDRLLNTKGDLALTLKRGFFAADYGVCIISPFILEHFGKTDWAKQLREVGPIIDHESAKAAREVTRAVRKTAAAAADDAAYAAAADDAAYAAADAAYAAAVAVAAAADAADDAAYAAAADAAYAAAADDAAYAAAAYAAAAAAVKKKLAEIKPELRAMALRFLSELIEVKN